MTAEPKGALGFFAAIMPVMAIGMIPIIGAYQPAVFSLLLSLHFRLMTVPLRILDV